MAKSSHGVAKPRVFYGWILVFVLLLILSVGVGTSMYMYSVIAGAVEQEFAVGRLVLMAGSTGLMLVVGFSSPVVGRLLDKYSSKGVLIGGSLVMGLGFILMGLSTQVWMVMASYVVFIAIGAATLSYLTAATLISRWFVRRRGLAIGVVSLGTQLGGFVYPPLFAAVMEAYNWRLAIGGLGLLIMLVVPLLTWLTIADRPEEMNQYPDGASMPPAQEPPRTGLAPGSDAKISFSRLIRERNFMLLIFILGIAIATNSVLMANLALFAIDLGEPVVRGAFLVSLVALLGIVFSPIIGWLCDVISTKVVMALLVIFYVVACSLFTAATTYPMLIIATSFMGVSGGGVYPLWASMVGQLYERRVYGQVMGTSTLLIAILTAAILLFAGWVHDVTASYRLLFLALLTMLVLTLALISLLRIPRRPAPSSPRVGEEGQLGVGKLS